MKKYSSVLVLVLLAACKKEEPKVELPPAKPPEPVKAPTKPVAAPKQKAPPISEAKMTALKADFAAARGYVKEADKFKAEGEAIEKAQGRAAANDTLVKAKELYRKACETAGDWIEGDLVENKVTDAQVKDYLNDYVTEVGRWQKAISEIGKVHKD